MGAFLGAVATSVLPPKNWDMSERFRLFWYWRKAAGLTARAPLRLSLRRPMLYRRLLRLFVLTFSVPPWSILIEGAFIFRLSSSSLSLSPCVDFRYYLIYWLKFCFESLLELLLEAPLLPLLLLRLLLFLPSVFRLLELLLLLLWLLKLFFRFFLPVEFMGVNPPGIELGLNEERLRFFFLASEVSIYISSPEPRGRSFAFRYFF